MSEHEMEQRTGDTAERTATSRRRFLLGLVAAGLAYTGPLLLGLDDAEAAPRTRRTRPSRRRPSRRPSRRRPSRRPSRRLNQRGPSRPGRPGPDRPDPRNDRPLHADPRRT